MVLAAIPDLLLVNGRDLDLIVIELMGHLGDLLVEVPSHLHESALRHASVSVML